VLAMISVCVVSDSSDSRYIIIPLETEQAMSFVFHIVLGFSSILEIALTGYLHASVGIMSAFLCPVKRARLQYASEIIHGPPTATKYLTRHARALLKKLPVQHDRTRHSSPRTNALFKFSSLPIGPYQKQATRQLSITRCR